MTEKNKDKFIGRVQIDRTRFFKNNWGIVLASVVKTDDKCEKPYLDKQNLITLKGSMPDPQLGAMYDVVATLIEDPKWGMQYEIKTMSSVIGFDTTNALGQRKYLVSLYTDNQVEMLYKYLDDPFKALNTADTESLVQVKGIRVKTALAMINKFQENYGLARMIIELEEYGLTNAMMQKLISNYGSADIAIEVVKNNPYSLIHTCSGIGWSKADAIAQAGGMSQYCTERISAYILYFLEKQAKDGFNYISTDLLMDGIVAEIGEDVPDLSIAESIHELGEKLWYNEEKTLIGLMRYYKLEEKIAKELLRIRDAENNFNIDGWEKIVKDLQCRQGWDFTDQQLLGIEAVLKNNVVCVTGKAGSGKTSIAEAMLKTLPAYSHCLAALSGRAGAKIAEVTGEEGFTIHRLLGYPGRTKNAKNGFDYHDENPLPYDIIIIDEVSMIGGYLWYYLLRAVKTGTKLILLGDVGQLEAIGECNVASDIIKSTEIPTVILDKIHRQAAKSAVITESLKAREGQQIIPKDWVGTEVRGEMKDLLIDCYSDKSNTFYKILEYFQKEYYKTQNILDIQIIVPIKSVGQACTYTLNNAIQELYNPEDKSKKQVEVYSFGKMYYLREGDKVINTQNNYKAFNSEGDNTPIYNGSIGILREIDESNDLFIIDFQYIGTVIIDRKQLNAIELGYAVTCHKYQGSSAKNVIVGLDYSAYTLLSREWVYTALTRAEKHCTLVAQNSALRYAISQEKVSEKTSHLVQLLNEIAHPKLIF